MIKINPQMKWIKHKMKGQITLQMVAGIFGAITIIGTPFLYISNIRAESADVDAKLNTAIVVNSTNIANLEKKIDVIGEDLKDIKKYLNVK